MKLTGYESVSSWLVTIGCCFIMLISMTPHRIAGLMYVSFIEYYETDRETASIPIFLFMTVRCLAGPFCAVLSGKMGTEKIIMGGVILAAIGFGGCFLARSVIEVSLLLGIVFGLGMTGSNTLLPTVIKKFFIKYVNTANGISQAGNCVGAVIVAPFAVYLLDNYGLHGTYLIISGLMLNGLPVGLLIQIASITQDKIIASIKKSNTLIQKETKHSQKVSNEVVEDLNTQKMFNHKKLSECSNEKKILSESELNKNTSIIKTNNIKGEKCDVLESENTNFVVLNGENGNIIMKNIDDCMDFKENPDIFKNECFTLQSLDCNISNVKEVSSSVLEKESNIPDKITRKSRQGDVIIENANLELDMENKPLFSTDVEIAIKLEDSSDITILPYQSGLKLQKKSSFHYFKVFIDPSFLIILLSTGLHNFVVVLVQTTTIDYSRDKLIPRDYEVYYLMIQPFCEIIGRMCFGWVTDLGYLTTCKYSMLCFTLMSVASGLIMWAVNVWSMIFGTMVFAVTGGAMTAIFPGMIFKYIPEKFHMMGIASRYCLSGPLIFTSTPLIGFFRGTHGSYDGLYLLFVAICLFCVGMMPLLNKFSSRSIKSKE